MIHQGRAGPCGRAASRGTAGTGPACTANGLIDDLPWDILDLPPAGTIFDVLTRNGVPWFNYHNIRPATVLLKRALGQNGLRAARSVGRIGRWFPRVTERVQGNKQFTADLYPLGIAGCVRHLRRTEQFFADSAAQYTEAPGIELRRAAPARGTSGAVIASARNPEQLAELLPMADLELSADELDRLDAASIEPARA